MIIDVHGHVLRWPIIKRGTNPLTFMDPDTQIRRMEEKGVDKMVILPLCSAEVAAEHQSMGEVFEIVRMHPDRFIPFCVIEPRRSDLGTEKEFRHVLEQYVEHGARGLGEVTARVYWDDQRLWGLLAAVQHHGIPVTFHTSPPEKTNTYGVIDTVGLPRFEKTLQQFHGVNFFGHSESFWSEISGDVTAETKPTYPTTPVKPGGTLVRLFREYPNLCGDLSAGSGYNLLTRDPSFTYEFIDEFQDRLMMGLDHTDEEIDFQHIEWLKAQNADGHISDEILDKLLWRNADRLIGLGIA